MLLMVSDEKGELQEADAAEMQLIEQMRRMGQESLQAWATGQAAKAAELAGQESGVWRGGKKNSSGTAPLVNQRRRDSVSPRKSTYSPFVNRAKVRHRGVRGLCNGGDRFWADVAFAQVEDKLVEHYGILLPESTIRRVTELHAENIYTTTQVDEAWPDEVGCRTVIVEMDGGMVPIVAADAAQKDRRKGKTLHWKEAKLCLAHEAGSKTLSYGGTLQGDVGEAGKQLFGCARSAGFGKASQVHAVGDGAEWIARQVDERFGSQGRYLVDFYHVCDYLSAAATAIHPDIEAANAWFSQQKAAIKAGHCADVIESLRGCLEADDVPDSKAAVRSCHRYLSRRQDQPPVPI